MCHGREANCWGEMPKHRRVNAAFSQYLVSDHHLINTPRIFPIHRRYLLLCNAIYRTHCDEMFFLCFSLLSHLWWQWEFFLAHEIFMIFGARFFSLCISAACDRVERMQMWFEHSIATSSVPNAQDNMMALLVLLWWEWEGRWSSSSWWLCREANKIVHSVGERAAERMT